MCWLLFALRCGRVCGATRENRRNARRRETEGERGEKAFAFRLTLISFHSVEMKNSHKLARKSSSRRFWTPSLDSARSFPVETRPADNECSRCEYDSVDNEIVAQSSAMWSTDGALQVHYSQLSVIHTFIYFSYTQLRVFPSPHSPFFFSLFYLRMSIISTSFFSRLLAHAITGHFTCSFRRDNCAGQPDTSPPRPHHSFTHTYIINISWIGC